MPRPALLVLLRLASPDAVAEARASRGRPVRTLVIGLAAIGLFGAAAFAAIHLATAEGPPRPPAAQAPAAAEPTAQAAVPGTPTLPSGGPAGPLYQPPPPLQAQVPVPRVLPPEGSWEAIPPAARAGALGPVGVDVGRDLIVLQEQLSACFNPEVASQTGRAAPTRTADPESQQDLAETILVLELEAGPGTVRIVDAPLESHGSADDMTIACAQRLLRGRTIPSQAARPGGRYRLLQQLHP
jgi:hypothetical protein